jgi:hypothetical protein
LTKTAVPWKWCPAVLWGTMAATLYRSEFVLPISFSTKLFESICDFMLAKTMSSFFIVHGTSVFLPFFSFKVALNSSRCLLYEIFVDFSCCWRWNMLCFTLVTVASYMFC